MPVHIAHHKQVSDWAKQNQSEIKHSIRRDTEQVDGRQPDERKQTTKQHKPEVTLVHLNLLSAVPFDRRKGNNQVSIFDPGDKFIERARRWTAEDVSQQIKVPVVAGADVML